MLPMKVVGQGRSPSPSSSSFFFASFSCTAVPRRCFSSFSSSLGLSPYRESLTQLVIHAVYQSLLLYDMHANTNNNTHHHRRRDDQRNHDEAGYAPPQSIEVECRLGQLIPKTHYQQQQQERHLNLHHPTEMDQPTMGSGKIRGGMGSASASSLPHHRRSILYSIPVVTPAVLHHRAQYQCRFDSGVSVAAFQRLEYLLSVPNRRPPYVLPPEPPLRVSSAAAVLSGGDGGVHTTLLPPLLALHGADQSRCLYTVENSEEGGGERRVAFLEHQKKILAYQTDVVCPTWGADVRLSVAVERTRHAASHQAPSSPQHAQTEKKGIESPEEEKVVPGDPWPEEFKNLFYHTQRSRTFVGRYMYVDMALVQAIPRHLLEQRYEEQRGSSGPEQGGGGGASTPLDYLHALYKNSSLSYPIERLQAIHLSLSTRLPHHRQRKVELELNMVNLYADWKQAIARDRERRRHVFTSNKKRTTGTRHRGAVQFKPVTVVSARQVVKRWGGGGARMPQPLPVWVLRSDRRPSSSPITATSHQPRAPSLSPSVDEYRQEVHKVFEKGLEASIFYPTLFEWDIHTPLPMEEEDQRHSPSSVASSPPGVSAARGMLRCRAPAQRRACSAAATSRSWFVVREEGSDTPSVPAGPRNGEEVALLSGVAQEMLTFLKFLAATPDI